MYSIDELCSTALISYLVWSNVSPTPRVFILEYIVAQMDTTHQLSMFCPTSYN